MNSIIWAPAHCETIPLSQKTYKLSGYAYNGGGRIPNRIMVTLNGGEDWRKAIITATEDPPDHIDTYGMNFCWILWELEVAVADLAQTSEIAVAAWDGQNTQPEKPFWNLMGMMSNSWFRVKVWSVPDEDAIWFDHPTRVEKAQDWASYDDKQSDKYSLYKLEDGNLASVGWMEEQKKEVEEVYSPKWDMAEGTEELEKGRGWEHYSGRRPSFFNAEESEKKNDIPPP